MGAGLLDELGRHACGSIESAGLHAGPGEAHGARRRRLEGVTPHQPRGLRAPTQGSRNGTHFHFYWEKDREDIIRNLIIEFFQKYPDGIIEFG
jgi:hypothetical protein